MVIKMAKGFHKRLRNQTERMLMDWKLNVNSCSTSFVKIFWEEKFPKGLKHPGFEIEIIAIGSIFVCQQLDVKWFC